MQMIWGCPPGLATRGGLSAYHVFCIMCVIGSARKRLWCRSGTSMPLAGWVTSPSSLMAPLTLFNLVSVLLKELHDSLCMQLWFTFGSLDIGHKNVVVCARSRMQLYFVYVCKKNECKISNDLSILTLTYKSRRSCPPFFLICFMALCACALILVIFQIGLNTTSKI